MQLSRICNNFIIITLLLATSLIANESSNGYPIRFTVYCEDSNAKSQLEIKIINSIKNTFPWAISY